MKTGGNVVTQQPGFDNVPMTSAMGSVPGLEYLAHVDQLIVKQQVELFEVLTGIETKNKYRVMNNQEQEVFFVAEESGCCMRYWCGPNRGFTFHVLSRTPTGQQQEVMSIERPFMCCKGCPWCADGCCMYPIHIKDASGQLLGTVRQTNFYCAPRFAIFDPSDVALYTITGDICRCQGPGCTGDVNFPIFNAGEGTQIGNIAKQWAGCGRECITDADHMGITFPMNMSIQHKALLLAGVFLVEMTLYERTQDGGGAH